MNLKLCQRMKLFKSSSDLSGPSDEGGMAPGNKKVISKRSLIRRIKNDRSSVAAAARNEELRRGLHRVDKLMLQ